MTRRWMALLAVLVVVGVSACADDSSTADLERSLPTSTADSATQVPPASAPAVADTAPPAAETRAPAAETGAPGLAWSKVFEVPEPFVVESIVSAHDGFYALAVNHDAGYYSPSMMWASEDGLDWVELDVADLFSDGATLRTLVASERGLMVLGFRPAPDGHTATAWFSGDGVVWDARDLGYVVEPTTQPYTTSLLSFGGAALGSNGAVVTATAFPGFDWTAAQQAAATVLPDDLAGIDRDRVATTNESVQVMVGPFVVYSESLETLGLEDVQEAQRITNSPSAATVEEPMTFVTSDLENWTVIDGNPVEAEFVMAIVAVGRDFVAAAFGRSGQAEMYVSSDGQAWEPAGEKMEGVGGLFLMGDRLVTDGWRGSQRVTLVSDDAGRTWEEVAAPDLNGSWITAAGTAGILATGTEDEIGWEATPEPAVIERDGNTITFDAGAELFTVADPTGAVLVSSALEMDDPRWGWGYTTPAELVFDFDDETAAVVHPSTGESLVTLTFADLDRFVEASGVFYGGEALLFSPDAEHWTVTKLDEAFGPETMLGASVVGTDRVVAVVGSGYPNPFDNQSIWVGLPVAGTAVPTVDAREAPPEVIMGGPAPAWERVLEVEEDGFDTMLAADSGLWAIAGDRFQPSALWHSIDGTAWTELDAAALLGEGAVVSEITQGGPGLLAAGSVPSGAAREAVAWTSADGQEWTVSPLGYEIPEPERPFEVADLMIQAVAAGPAGAVIAATPYAGIDHGLLEPNVAAALPIGLRDYASGTGVMIDPWEISVSVGPFAVFSEAVGNLDVDQDLFDAYARGTSAGGFDTVLFVTNDYQNWRQVDDWPGSGHPVAALAATADGYLATVWAWGGGPGPYTSTDGIAWKETELPADPGTVQWFGTGAPDRLLMAGELGGRSAVWESGHGGASWDLLTALPDDAWDVRAGGFGLVAMGGHDPDWVDSSAWTATVVEHEGLTLSVEAGRDGCTVTGPDGETLFTADVSSAGLGPVGFALPSFIAADHDRAIFTVGDPDGGDPLMTVTYGEMQEAYELAQGPAGLGPDMFVAFSVDGRVWSEQPISELAGVTGWIGPVAVGDDHAVIVVNPLDGSSSLWRATTRVH